MTELIPKEFDLDAWIEGARRPSRSVTVYRRADLLADLDVLAEKINNEDDDEGPDGPSMGGGAAGLVAEYNRVATEFHNSALTIRIEGRDEKERENVVLRVPNLNPEQRGAVALADAIVSPKFTPEQVELLAKKIGEAQFSRVVARFHEACKEMPEVSADFLQKRSTQGAGGDT